MPSAKTNKNTRREREREAGRSPLSQVFANWLCRYSFTFQLGLLGV